MFARNFFRLLFAKLGKIDKFLGLKSRFNDIGSNDQGSNDIG